MLDAVKPIVLRNNRWRCDHGWDIDLDDGSTNYHIYNNLCLHGGIKLREGFRRVCENNIMVGDSLHPHVWFGDSGDVVRRNIVFAPYRPIGMPQPWGEECDFNLLHHAGQKVPRPARQLQKQSGRDEHSLEADALFLDPRRGDYRVADDSPALKLGFVNFPMDQFGVRKPELRKIARTPPLPDGGDAPRGGDSKRDGRETRWLGAKVKNVVGPDEASAAGLPGEVGVLVVDAPADGAAAKAGLRKMDVILRLNGKGTNEVEDLRRLYDAVRPGQTANLTVYRDQRETAVSVEGGLSR